jgi:hypothetical protein
MLVPSSNMAGNEALMNLQSSASWQRDDLDVHMREMVSRAACSCVDEEACAAAKAIACLRTQDMKEGATTYISAHNLRTVFRLSDTLRRCDTSLYHLSRLPRSNRCRRPSPRYHGGRLARAVAKRFDKRWRAIKSSSSST